MKILISGASGLVGSRLARLYEEEDVGALVRREPEDSSEVYWKPSDGEIDREGVSGYDAVVHLAGESIVGRWSEEKKRAIKESRVSGTSILSEALAEADDPPDVLVCASAIGYYGDRGDQILDEESASGELFLSEVCEEWEAAADPAREAGIRVAHARFGVILSPSGGALAKMLFPFKMGIGGRIGDGEQWMSWIDIYDAVHAVDHIVKTEDMSGPVNVVAPNPVRNRQFTTAMGDVLSRPTLFPMPAFAARLLFGEMADELLLASTCVQPRRLREHDFNFEYPHLKDSLLHLLVKQEDDFRVMSGS